MAVSSFNVGRKYRIAGPYSYGNRKIEVVSRTEKMLTFKNPYGQVQKRLIRVDDYLRSEYIYPFGKGYGADFVYAKRGAT